MTDAVRQWQTTIKTGRKNPDFAPHDLSSKASEWIVGDSKTFYGDTLPSLRQSVSEWLTENRVPYFATETATCYYSDGTQTDEYSSRRAKSEGWYVDFRGNLPTLGGKHSGSFEGVLEGFIMKGIYIEKGPDHQDTPIIDGKLQLHLIKTLKRIREEYKVNEYLNRGWYIVSIDHVSEPDSQSIYSVYVLGHPEENAL